MIANFRSKKDGCDVGGCGLRGGESFGKSSHRTASGYESGVGGGGGGGGISSECADTWSWLALRRVIISLKVLFVLSLILYLFSTYYVGVEDEDVHTETDTACFKRVWEEVPEGMSTCSMCGLGSRKVEI